MQRGSGRRGRVDGAVWMGVARKQQAVYNIDFLLQASQLTAIAPAEPIPPHYILLALCLLARPLQSVFRVQCLCVSPPSDLRLQRTSTPRRVRAAILRLVSSRCLSHSLCLQHRPCCSALLCSARLDSAWHRLLLRREPGAAVVVVLPSTRTTLLPIHTHTTRGSYRAQQAISTSTDTRLHP